jgi:hypothetical protein
VYIQNYAARIFTLYLLGMSIIFRVHYTPTPGMRTTAIFLTHDQNVDHSYDEVVVFGGRLTTNSGTALI